MKPRSVAIALAVGVSFVSTSYAQPTPAQPTPQDRLQSFEAVAKQLNLTPAQKMQLVPILQAEEPKLQAIKNDPSLSRAEKLQRLRAIHEESNPRVKAILTPAQFQQLQVIRQQRIAQLMQQARGGAGRPLTPPRTQQK